MRIEAVSVKNLRCIKSANINLDPYTCFVGPNGAGKSTLLCALNIFFRNTEAATDVLKLAVADFHHQGTRDPVEVTVTFADLSEEAEEDFKGYVRQGKLIISAVAEFDPNTNNATVIQFGERLGFKDFADFFKRVGDGAKVGEVRPIYEALKAGKYGKLPDWKSLDSSMNALRDFEASRPDECDLLRSADQFYGATKGAGRLEKYLQWVYIPAVKDATDEEAESRDSALGKLLARTVRKKVDFQVVVDTILNDARVAYQKMLDDNQAVLVDLSAALTARLQEWAHPAATLDLEWQQDSMKAVRAEMPLANVLAGEAQFKGKLARFGHGFQRSFLLALLQELASSEDTDAPTLLLACEEPELYQHPPQARHLASVFESLSGGNAQILVTTHSPYFVTGRDFESVRMFRRNAAKNCSEVSQFDYGSLAKRFANVTGDALKNASAAMVKVHQVLQPTLNEMFFTQRLILVEGLEDVSYLQTWMVLTGRWEAFRRAGCHIVPASGKSELIRPAIIAEGLYIPFLVIFDCDGSKQGTNQQPYHIRDNVALMKVMGGTADDVFPKTITWNERFVCWPENFGKTVEAELRGTMGDEAFEKVKGAACQMFDTVGDLNKATLYIGALLTNAIEQGGKSPSLDRVSDWVIGN